MKTVTTFLLLLACLFTLACDRPEVKGSITIYVENQTSVPTALFEIGLGLLSDQLSKEAGFPINLVPKPQLRGDVSGPVVTATQENWEVEVGQKVLNLIKE